MASNMSMDKITFIVRGVFDKIWTPSMNFLRYDVYAGNQFQQGQALRG